MPRFIVSVLFLSLFSITGSSVLAASHDEQQVQTAGDKQAPKKVFDTPQPVGTKATCPVTGESFIITKSTAHSEYKGKHVYFCCPGCKPQFDKDPDKFLKDESPKPPAGK